MSRKMADRPLKEVTTNDLVSRWESVLPDYLVKVEQFQKLVLEIDKKRNELILIRNELAHRSINVDEKIPDDRPDSEP